MSRPLSLVHHDPGFGLRPQSEEVEVRPTSSAWTAMINLELRHDVEPHMALAHYVGQMIETKTITALSRTGLRCMFEVPDNTPQTLERVRELSTEIAEHIGATAILGVSVDRAKADAAYQVAQLGLLELPRKL